MSASTTTSRWRTWLAGAPRLSGLGRYLRTLLISIGVSLAVGSVIILIVGYNPLEVYSLLLAEAFFKPRGLMIAIQRATPLILTSAAAAMGFQSGVINMALASQFSVGAAIGAIAAYTLPPLPFFLHIPLILLLSAAGGAAAGFVPALLTRMSGVHEIVTGVISNYVVGGLVGLFFTWTGLLSLARSRAASGGFPVSAQLPQFAELTGNAWGAGTKANVGIFVSMAIVLWLAWWIRYSTLGYELRMTRLNRHFAQFAGIRAGRGFFLGLMLSGAIAAMAGAVEIMGVWRQYRLGTLNVGEKDLVIALIGGQNFIGAMLTSLVYGGLESGALNVGFSTSIPRPLVDILVELLVIFAAVPSMRTFVASGHAGDSDHLGGQFYRPPDK